MSRLVLLLFLPPLRYLTASWYQMVRDADIMNTCCQNYDCVIHNHQSQKTNIPSKYAKGAEPPERGRCLTHIDLAQLIEHEPERAAAYGCYHRLYGMRQYADPILEVAEMYARLHVHLRVVIALLSRLLRCEKRAEDRILCEKHAYGLYQLKIAFEFVSTKISIESSNEMSLCSITKRLHPQ
jgi:hypothetical protein